MNLRQPWRLGPAGGLLAWRSLRAPPTGSRPGQGSVYQTCYGLDGAGRMPEVPNIAGDGEIYLAKQLKGYRSGERRHEQMSIIAASLSEDQIADVAAYYASIESPSPCPSAERDPGASAPASPERPPRGCCRPGLFGAPCFASWRRRGRPLRRCQG